MKKIILTIIIVLVLVGCKDQETSSSTTDRIVVINVSFENGFKGDSIDVISDSKIIMRGRFYSDSLNVPSGCVFNVKEGLHDLDIFLPLQNTFTHTLYNASRDYATIINLHYDRNHNVLTKDIIYYKY